MVELSKILSEVEGVDISAMREYKYARVVELVDTLALGASAARREGSSPFSRTKRRLLKFNQRSKGLPPDKGGSSFVI